MARNGQLLSRRLAFPIDPMSPLIRLIPNSGLFKTG